MNCTATLSARWANGRPVPPHDATNQEVLHWRHETAECWDCGARVPLITDPGPKSDRLVLAPHEPNQAAQSEEKGPR
jgi:hypothetical protein